MSLLVSIFLVPATLADQPIEEISPYEAQYITASYVPTPEKPIIKNIERCNCVLYVKKLLGITQSLGVAKNIPVSTKEPFIGAIVITYESVWGHAAIVDDVQGDNLILIESNFEHCKTTEGRKLSIYSPLIKGYR